MKTVLFAFTLIGLAAAQVSAQDCSGNCGNSNTTPPWAGAAGPVTANCVGLTGYPTPAETLALAHRDHFSPKRVYAYSRTGVDATRMNSWNQQKAAECAWHGEYNYWRFGVPTALVVPPTAVFQSEYNWGVAQTKSIPIYHQFGRNYSDVGGGGMFANRPYWPSSTNQFGIYPVRAPH
jgi:hypothetical protein